MGTEEIAEGNANILGMGEWHGVAVTEHEDGLQAEYDFDNPDDEDDYSEIDHFEYNSYPSTLSIVILFFWLMIIGLSGILMIKPNASLTQNFNEKEIELIQEKSFSYLGGLLVIFLIIWAILLSNFDFGILFLGKARVSLGISWYMNLLSAIAVIILGRIDLIE